jgi:hypothetical protein
MKDDSACKIDGARHADADPFDASGFFLKEKLLDAFVNLRERFFFFEFRHRWTPRPRDNPIAGIRQRSFDAAASDVDTDGDHLLLCSFAGRMR